MVSFYIKQLKKPATPQEFREEGGYGHFTVYVIDYKKEMTFKGKLDTCSPSFLITGPVRKIEGNIIHGDNKAEMSYSRRNPNIITMEDACFFVAELRGVKDADKLIHAIEYPCTVAAFKALELFKQLEVEQNCDYFRFDYEVPLKVALPKQKKQIRLIPGNQLRELYDMFMREPWKLLFHRYVSTYHLKEMMYEGFLAFYRRYNRAIVPAFQCAARLYCFLKQQREEGNEVFEVQTTLQQFHADTNWGFGQEVMNTKSPPFQLLMYHGLCYALDDDTRYVCFPRDKTDNLNLYNALKHNIVNEVPRLRKTRETPCLPSPTLTEEQKTFVKHVMCNRVSFLEGAPGTGKTEVLIAIVAELAATLNVTYVGMMVDVLERRLGSAYTIHYVCCLHDFQKDVAEAWFQQLDVLIIDEGSNVDRKLLSWLIRCMHAPFKRLVIVGDLGQIFPIKPGAPFFDLTQAFASHTFLLTENKRVDANSRILVTAAQSIRYGQPVDFSQGGEALQLHERSDIDQRKQLCSIVAQYCRTKEDTMNFQVVVLRNVDRNMCNSWIEEWLLENRILSAVNKVRFGDQWYYPGKKIQFTKNTKPPPGSRYDGVRNGELGQILKIKNNVITLTNGKQVLIHESAVSPFNIQAGYATTCNKAQGSEWQTIIFYIYEKPIRFFTREYAYVAVSRAKQRCIIIGTEDEFNFLCAEKAKPRNTLLNYYLTILPLTELQVLHPFGHIELKNPKDLILNPAAVIRPQLGDGNQGKKKKSKNARG